MPNAVGLVQFRAFDPNIGTFIMLAFMLLVFLYLYVFGKLPTARGVTNDIAALKAEMAQLAANERKLKMANVDLHNVVEMVAAQNSELASRVKTLEDELRSAVAERDRLKERNGHLEYMLNALRPTGNGVAVGVANKGLRDALVKLFSVAELTTLCSDLGVKYDDVEGETKLAKAQGIVDYFQRRDELPLLTTAVKRLRPHAQF